MDLEKHIIEIEKDLLEPQTRTSPERLLELISEDFKEIGANGACFGLTEVLETLPRESGWSSRTQDWEFRVLGEGIVQTTHRAFVISDGGDPGDYSLRTSIWRLEEESWKMVYHQGTKVSPFELKD